MYRTLIHQRISVCISVNATIITQTHKFERMPVLFDPGWLLASFCIVV